MVVVFMRVMSLNLTVLISLSPVSPPQNTIHNRSFYQFVFKSVYHSLSIILSAGFSTIVCLSVNIAYQFSC